MFDKACWIWVTLKNWVEALGFGHSWDGSNPLVMFFSVTTDSCVFFGRFLLPRWNNINQHRKYSEFMRSSLQTRNSCFFDRGVSRSFSIWCRWASAIPRRNPGETPSPTLSSTWLYNLQKISKELKDTYCKRYLKDTEKILKTLSNGLLMTFIRGASILIPLGSRSVGTRVRALGSCMEQGEGSHILLNIGARWIINWFEGILAGNIRKPCVFDRFCVQLIPIKHRIDLRKYMSLFVHVFAR